MIMAPSRQDWEDNKNNIRKYYYEPPQSSESSEAAKDSKPTLEKMMKRMETEHHFFASKNQYETKFNEWGFRKNLSKNESTYILYKKHKRDEAGKDSVFTWHGSEIPLAKRKRLESRFTLSELHHIKTGQIYEAYSMFRELSLILTEGPSPPSPETISVFTPSSGDSTVEAFGESMAVVRIVRSPHLSKRQIPRNVQKDNLPYWQFLSLWESRSTCPCPSTILEYFADIYQGGLDLESILVANASLAQGHPFTSPAPPVLDFDDVLLDLYFSPTFSYNESIPELAFNAVTPMVVLGHRSIFEFFGLEAKLANIPPQLAPKVNLPELFLQELQDTMLERFSGDLKTRVNALFGLNETEAFVELLKLFVYYSSNSLEAIDRHQHQRVINLFLGLDPVLLRRIYSLKVPSVKAFLHSLIRNAECTSDMEGGRSLLSADIDRNLYPDRPEKLFLVAVKFNHLKMVREMISDGFDVNCTFNRHKDGETPLSSAKSVEMVQVLCAAGADVNKMIYYNWYTEYRYQPCVPLITSAVRSQRIDIIRALLKENAPVSGLPAECLENAIQSDNAEIIKLLLDAKASFKGPFHNVRQDGHRVCCETLLQSVACSGSIDVLEVLLDRSLYIEELRSGHSEWVVLRDAVQGGHLITAKQLLDAGANVNATSNAISVSDGYFLKYLGEDMDITRKYSFGMTPSTPLLAAVETKNIQMVKLLIRHNANVNQVGLGKFGSTAIETGRRLEQWDICNFLAKGGEGVARAIHTILATGQQDEEDIRRCIELWGNPAFILDGDSEGHVNARMLSAFLGVCGGNISSTGPKTGRSPLQIALHLKEVNMAQYLVIRGANLNPPGCKPMFYLRAAIKTVAPFEVGEPLQAKLELVNLILNKAGLSNDPINFESSPLNIAIDLGVLELVKILVNAGANIYKIGRGHSSLRLALRNALDANDHFHERQIIFEYLLLTANLIDTSGMQEYDLDFWSYPLSETIKWGDHNAIYPQLLRLLMEHYPYHDAPALVREGWENALRAAAYAGDLSTVKLLLEFGVDVNARPPYDSYYPGPNSTALQSAAYGGNMDIALELIRNGAEINAAVAEDYGRTALQGAAKYGDIELVLMLLEGGADIEAPPARTFGTTALQGAVYNGNLKLVALLLERGADVNAPGSIEGGNTALDFASLYGRLDIVQLLLDAGAESLVTAKVLADREDHFVIAELLDKEIRKRDMGHVTEVE